MFKKSALALGLVIFSSMSNASTTTYSEDFEAAFPSWESSWLAQNSNIQNYYGISAYRGNNPDGLWIADGLSNGSITEITFDSAFGKSVTNFSIDVTTWISGAKFEAFDMSGKSIASSLITSMYGAYSDPGQYQTISFSTTNGLSGFNITGGSIEGNTSIDNVVATVAAVPEPETYALMGVGLLGLLAARRKQEKTPFVLKVITA
jgi:hypothetical protein